MQKITKGHGLVGAAVAVVLMVLLMVLAAGAMLGDYFGNGDSGELARRLVGGTLEERDVRARLADADIGSYFNNMDLDTFCSILLE